MATISFADELIIDFSEKSVPVLNDELRKLRNAINKAVGTVNNPKFSPSKIYDADEDTKVDTEESADEDIIRMDSAGTEIVTADSDQFGVNSGIKLGVDGNDGESYIVENEISGGNMELWVDGVKRVDFGGPYSPIIFYEEKGIPD